MSTVNDFYYEKIKKLVENQELTFNEFKRLAACDNRRWRVTRTQSKTDENFWYNHIVTRDYNPQRFNIWLDSKNMVAKLTLG